MEKGLDQVIFSCIPIPGGSNKFTCSAGYGIKVCDRYSKLKYKSFSHRLKKVSNFVR